jgi:hypothetical protein
MIDSGHNTDSHGERKKKNAAGKSPENEQLHPDGFISKVGMHVKGPPATVFISIFVPGSCAKLSNRSSISTWVIPVSYSPLQMSIQIGEHISLPDFPLLLAPMEDVSDPPFRYVCKKFGADLMYSEFISSEGLIRDAIKSKQKLDFFEYERPFGIQIFGGDEEAMSLSARIIDATNPDLVDINFGCPVKKVV